MKLFALLTLTLLCNPIVHAKQTEKFEKPWSTYVAETEKNDLQENCKPQWIKAKADVPFKGTIMLHHGFTACTQQYFEWSKNYLSPKGYDVLLVVLPGHGLVWDENKNDLDGYPTRDNWYGVYHSAVQSFNSIMAESSGDHVVGGLSVGAEVALDSALEEPNLYQRVILFTPFFRLSSAKKEFGPDDSKWVKFLQSITGGLNKKKGALVDFVANPKNRLCKLADKRQTWGKGCEVTERKNGRAGYCQFTFDAVSADQQYGSLLLNKTQSALKLPKMQVLGVENDPTAASFLTRRFVENAKLATGVAPNLCFFHKDANHSLLSRFDSPKENKYWIPFLLEQATAFVVSGTEVKKSISVSDIEANYPYCDVSSENPKAITL